MDLQSLMQQALHLTTFSNRLAEKAIEIHGIYSLELVGENVSTVFALED
jgi:hypothetical protein